jgi:hypothetical protein
MSNLPISIVNDDTNTVVGGGIYYDSTSTSYFNVTAPTNEVFKYIVVSGFAVSSSTSYTIQVTNGSLETYNGSVYTPVGTTVGGVVDYTNTLGSTVPGSESLNSLWFVPVSGTVATVTITASAAGGTYQDLFYVECFAEGTRIACPEGERAVETLRPGEMVLTSAGVARPVSFIGRRTLDLTQDPINAPVRIPAGAIADGVPSRDLRVSPDHAVMMENVLIPARSLIGDAVVQERGESVTYYHIQLESHDIVLAENTPCETLLNTDDPSNFDNADEAVITDAFLAPCLPRVTQGQAVEAARNHIRARMLVSA